jgi:hypothetical protein
LKASTFRRFHEEQMAQLFLNNRAEFDRLFEKGRRYFHGAMPGAEGDD